MARRVSTKQRPQLAIVDARIAYDRQITDLGRRLYIALFASEPLLDSPQWITVSARDWSTKLGCTAETVRNALSRLAQRGFIERERTPGARTQHVRRVMTLHA